MNHEDVLRTYRERLADDDALSRQTFERIERTLAREGAAAELVESVYRRRRRRLGWAVAAAALVLGMLGIAALSSPATFVEPTRSSRPMQAAFESAGGRIERAAERARAKPGRVDPRPPPPPVQAPEATDIDSEPVPDAERPAEQPRGPARRARRPRVTEGSLADELLLIRRAKSLLDQGKAPDARALLKEHAQRFRSGQMASDRKALQVEARCRSGHDDAARRAATRWAEASPRSPYLQRVKRACALGER